MDCNTFEPFWYVYFDTFRLNGIDLVNGIDLMNGIDWKLINFSPFDSYVCDDYVINDTRSRHIEQLRSKLQAVNE